MTRTTVREVFDATQPGDTLLCYPEGSQRALTLTVTRITDGSHVRPCGVPSNERVLVCPFPWRVFLIDGAVFIDGFTGLKARKVLTLREWKGEV